MSRKILQIIPANGNVYARFAKSRFNDAGEDRIHCWALVEDDDEGTIIRGMIMVPNCNGLDYADVAEEFIGIYER